MGSYHLHSILETAAHRGLTHHKADPVTPAHTLQSLLVARKRECMTLSVAFLGFWLSCPLPRQPLVHLSHARPAPFTHTHPLSLNFSLPCPCLASSCLIRDAASTHTPNLGTSISLSHNILQVYPQILTWEIALSLPPYPCWAVPSRKAGVVCTSQPTLTAHDWHKVDFQQKCLVPISVQFSRSVASDSVRPHESQYARPPCPSSTPGVQSNSHPLSRWCHPAISSSVVPFSSCPQSFPALESFPMSQLFT